MLSLHLLPLLLLFLLLPLLLLPLLVLLPLLPLLNRLLPLLLFFSVRFGFERGTQQYMTCQDGPWQVWQGYYFCQTKILHSGGGDR